MKFIEDYLSGLFECKVCDVSLDFHSPANILGVRGFGDEEGKAVYGGRGMIRVQLRFQAFDNNLPNQKGSLHKTAQYIHYKNLSEYAYNCLLGEETNKLFEYALGKEE